MDDSGRAESNCRIGITTKKNEADSYYPANHTKFEDYSKEDFFRKGSYQLNNGKSSDLSGDFNINYSKSIDKHYLFLNGGLSLSEKTFDEVIHYAEGFPSDKMDHIMFARPICQRFTADRPRKYHPGYGYFGRILLFLR